jgi:hypothetical protein
MPIYSLDNNEVMFTGTSKGAPFDPDVQITGKTKASASDNEVVFMGVSHVQDVQDVQDVQGWPNKMAKFEMKIANLKKKLQRPL